MYIYTYSDIDQLLLYFLLCFLGGYFYFYLVTFLEYLLQHWLHVTYLSPCVLYQQPPTLLHCYCSPFSSHSFLISPNTVLSSHSPSSSPSLLSTFCPSDLCHFFTSHYFHMTGPFQPAPHQCLLNRYGALINVQYDF